MAFMSRQSSRCPTGTHGNFGPAIIPVAQFATRGKFCLPIMTMVAVRLPTAAKEGCELYPLLHQWSMSFYYQHQLTMPLTTVAILALQLFDNDNRHCSHFGSSSQADRAEPGACPRESPALRLSSAFGKLKIVTVNQGICKAGSSRHIEFAQSI